MTGQLQGEISMQKLAAADASFLYAETKNCTSNIGSVDMMNLPEGVTSKQFIETLKPYLANRAHLVPYMTRKLAFVPGNWDHPAWVHDKNFDINNHVIEYPVAAPGGRVEMEEAIARIHEIKMPLERPLWAWWVLTGLENGKVAIYGEAHHATLDGASGNAAYEILMEETREHTEVEPPEAEIIEGDESPLRMIEESFNNFMRFQLESGKRMMGAMDTSRRLMQRAIDPSKDFGALGKVAPKTPFNTHISETRSWACAEIPLADVKAMGKSVSGTVNDIVMAVCAGGLRSYLERKGELPEESLIAGCPVSLRKPGDKSLGNQVTMMNVELGTDIAEPLERIFAIRASTETAKEMVAELSGVYESNASLPGMPALVSANINAIESFGLAQWFRGPINVCISNVPGPRNTLYANGAEMTTHYPVSIATHGVGLNITVQSYRDQLYWGITACGKTVPDAGELRNDLIEAFRSLRARLLPMNVSELKPRSLAAAPAKQAVEDNAQVA
ncbi:MAG: wax ester/triacylglycerol synthase family O-acyltransferase [Pseudomonadales bacterium]|nr:wax ester/triacylglycerol synthase family O-acyltransferase [Pseudomonadales bacterium]